MIMCTEIRNLSKYCMNVSFTVIYVNQSRPDITLGGSKVNTQPDVKAVARGT